MINTWTHGQPENRTPSAANGSNNAKEKITNAVVNQFKILCNIEQIAIIL